MILYQVYCESDNDQVISALYQAPDDQKAREKIKLYVRESVITKQISWLITIHRSDWEIDLSDLDPKSPQSIELKYLLLNPEKWPEDWIWMEQVDTTKTGPDMDITAILDYFQDDGQPQAIEVSPVCIELPDKSWDDVSDVYPESFRLEGEIISSKDQESIGKRISIKIAAGELHWAPWRPGKACLAMTRIVQNRQFESEWEVI